LTDVPVAFLVFNRPELTAQVFSCIRAARPKELFVIADGPRRPEERDACERTREIATSVDWECTVYTNFSETNLGCGKRVSSGLTWLFEHCDQAIILEDDCVADPTFFQFCAELLDKYKDDEQIAMISGDNFMQSFPATSKQSESYYFSRFSHIWGWATWRRAWKHYDFKMQDWPEVRATGWPRQIFGPGPQTELWRSNFDGVYSGMIDTWDFQWQYTVLRQNAFAGLPVVNLISNIGFGESATHTKTVNSQSCLVTEPMTFPLVHPAVIEPDLARDQFTFQSIFLATKKRSILQRIRARASRLAAPVRHLFSARRSKNPI
jgi:hypothetical protein